MTNDQKVEVINMATKVATIKGLKRKKGYLYYVKGNSVYMAKMARRGKKR